MSKLNKIFGCMGGLLLAGGILLLRFPDVMKYVFAVAAIGIGIVLVGIAWNGKRGN